MILTPALVVGITLLARIPRQAQWEITFAQVEAAADLPDLSAGAADALEARVMQRPWSAQGPLPFLRITRTGGALSAQPFFFWKPDRMHPPRNRPPGPDIVCRDGVCVRPVGMTEQRDWEDFVRRLAIDACGQRPPGGCVDCEHVWTKTRTDTAYREQSCNMPPAESLAGIILRFMRSAADESRQRQAVPL